MFQLSLFAPKKQIPEISKNRWQLFVDGASRNNPGIAGAGIFIKKNNDIYKKKSFFLNSKTNNEAEYLALILGILIVKEDLEKDDVLEIISDSELLVKQMKKSYRVKKPELQKLFNVVQNLLKDINFKINHVLRAHNKEADELANEAIDKRSKIPNDLLLELNSYDITI